MNIKALLITIALILTLAAFGISAAALEATTTASTVLVNGKDVSYDAYLIEGNNYFKLRDLAFTLNGSEKQFDVGWDGDANAISLTSGQAYTVVGGEMVGKGVGAKTPTSTGSKIIKDGVDTKFTAYNIDGNNYFKLRDIGEAFDFGVDWDGGRNTIVIDTKKGYTAPSAAEPPPATTPPSTTPTADKPKITDLNQLRAHILTLPVDEPTGGKRVSAAELNGILAPYYSKFNLDSENTVYSYTTTGDYIKKSGKWEMDNSVVTSEMWSKDVGKYNKMYMEVLTVFNSYDKSKEGVTECTLMTEDDEWEYIWMWTKGAKEGQFTKYPKQPSTHNNELEDNYVNPYDGILYNDQTVDKQLCKVFNYIRTDEADAEGFYFWLSTVRGGNIMYSSYNESGSEQHMNFTFETKNVNKDDSFFVAPGNVIFTDMMSSGGFDD